MGAFSYIWYSNIINSNTSRTPIEGETNNTFTPPTDMVGTVYYYCVISQPASLSYTITSNVGEVIVNPAPFIDLQPQLQDLCLGNAVNALSVSYLNGVSTSTYQWYSNTVDNTTSGTAIAGATTNTYTPDVSAVSTTYYYCIITFALGRGSKISLAMAEIIVNETPSISNFMETLCSKNSFTVTPDGTSGDIVPANTTYT